MRPSLLSRLPDVITMARERARDLLGRLDSAARPPSPWQNHHHHDAAQWLPSARGGHAARLLVDSDLRAMLELLRADGAASDWRGRTQFIWLDGSGAGEASSARHEMALFPAARWLLDQPGVLRPYLLALRLYIARELLAPDAVVAVSGEPDPDGCMAHILRAVLSHRAHWVVGHAPAAASRALACRVARTRLRTLLDTHSRDGDRVLVLQACVDFAPLVAQLDRRWTLTHSNAMVLSLLRERIVANQVQGAVNPP